MVLAHDINVGQRTQDVHINQDITFNSMLLSARTLQGLNDSGFHRPSPIQLHGIPLGKCGFDLLLEAKSGTGKTAVFSVIALEKIDLNKGLQVVILAPTREIAMQIHDVIKQIGVTYEGLCVVVVMGGLPVLDDVEKFKKNVHIVVGSPGRLKHLIHDKYIVTNSVRLLILDEADKLMEKSFEADINYIHSALPQQKQVIMSSATFPESSKSFIGNYVQNAQHICPDSNNVLLGIEQMVTLVKYSSNIVKQTQYKYAELVKILSNRQFKQCLIFCNYQARVTELHKMLNKEKWPAEQLYGQQQQIERLDALKILQDYKCRLLIATDLAARGIDASNVDLVINFETPCNWETYLHRIGRAGRFGSYGLAITILSEGLEYNNFKSLIENLKLPFLLKDIWSRIPFGVNNTLPDKCVTPEVNNADLVNNSQSISKNSEEVNYSKLWDALTGDRIETEVESFGNLCESFTKPENRIDLFSDLIQSFKQNEDIDKENFVNEIVSFPQLDLLKLPGKCKNVVNKCNEKEEFSKHGSNYQTIAECEVILNHKENPDNIYYALKNNNVNSIRIDKNLVTNNNNHKMNSHNGTYCYTNGSSHQEEFENARPVLSDFNLPSAFSSSKEKKSGKITTHTSIVNNVNSKRETRRNRSHKNTKISSGTKIKELSNQKNRNTVIDAKELNDSDINKEEENSVNQSDLTKSRLQHSQHTNKNIHMHKNKTKQTKTYHTLNKYEHQNEREYCNKKYMEWYNSLKLHVRQIEQIIYFNEIRKL